MRDESPLLKGFSQTTEHAGNFLRVTVKLSVSSVVTGAKSFTGSKGSFLNMCGALVSVELPGVIISV